MLINNGIEEVTRGFDVFGLDERNPKRARQTKNASGLRVGTRGTRGTTGTSGPQKFSFNSLDNPFGLGSSQSISETGRSSFFVSPQSNHGSPGTKGHVFREFDSEETRFGMKSIAKMQSITSTPGSLSSYSFEVSMTKTARAVK